MPLPLTAGLVYGGGLPGSPGKSSATEEYDGTSWTNGGDLSLERKVAASSVNGTQTASYVTTGGSPPGLTAATEQYDGSSWTSGGSAITAREQAMGGGTLTAGLLSGGNSAAPAVLTSTELNGL